MLLGVNRIQWNPKGVVVSYNVIVFNMAILLFLVVCAFPVKGEDAKPSRTFRAVDLVNVIDIPEEGITTDELYKLVASYHSKANAAFTLQDIKHLTVELSGLYRKKGYVFVRAYIPPQDIKNDIVKIAFTPNRLVDFSVSGGSHYDKSRLMSYFTPHLGKLVNSLAIERSLNQLNKTQGLFNLAPMGKNHRTRNALPFVMLWIKLQKTRTQTVNQIDLPAAG